VAWEATRKRADLDFFAAHSVSELWNWTDFALEDAGRLTHPPAFADFNERVSQPCGFRLYIAASERVWLTPNGKANFIVFNGLDCDTRASETAALMLATIRSHDQYNTTIYGFNDRYRGIKSRRDVLFMHKDDLAARGLSHGDLVDVEAIPEAGDVGQARVLRNLTAVAFEIARNSAAAYYPEANPLIALQHYDVRSGTPAYKSVPVRVRKAAQAPTDARLEPSTVAA
jgi:anaerobic selenocysteine-containing dehydrogenase